MPKRRSHHHESAETLQAERDVARLLQRVEAEHARLGHHGNIAAARLARRRERIWKVAGVALLVAALVAILGTIVWSFR
jgi:ferric-dicitrate binding protein FerR (iron transport regulator)